MKLHVCAVSAPPAVFSAPALMSRLKLKQTEASKRNAAKSEAKMKKLQAEIEHTKAMRVKLAKDIQEKTEQHR